MFRARQRVGPHARRVVRAAVAVLLLATRAAADEIKVMTSGAFTAAHLAVTPEFERTTHHHVVTVYGASMGNAPDSIPNRLQRGEPADVVIMAAQALDDLIRQGKVIAGSRVDLVRSRIGLAVRAGAPRPDVTSVDALRRALLQAKSIAYSSSASGVYISTELLPRLGIADAVKAKSRVVDSGPVGVVVARGDAEIGFQQVSELLPVEGIDFVGPLPAGAQRVTVFSAGVAASSRAPEAARALIAFLSSPAAAPAIRKTGLEPLADEITLIAPGGIRTAIDQLIPAFERRSGYHVNATFGSGGGTKQQVIRGEAFDVPIVQPPLADVVSSGHVVASSETPLATVAVGVAVRKGAAKPDISTADAVKRMLLAAKAISYPNGASGAAAGASFDKTLAQLGITAEMEPKITRAQGGAGAMTMLAKGEVDIGLTFLSEMSDPGVDVVGPLPRAISTPTALVGFVSAHAKSPDGAKALLTFLSSPEAAAVYRACGLQPGR